MPSPRKRRTTKKKRLEASGASTPAPIEVKKKKIGIIEKIKRFLKKLFRRGKG
jgi:hypothetical protein